VLLVCALFLIVNYRIVLGRVAPVWDADTFFCPYYMLVADYARSGSLLLWNPWTNAGSPDFCEPQVGAFSPLTLALGLITGGSEHGFLAYWLVVWLLGGVGIVLLARHLQAPPWGACLVALAFLFSGFYTGQAEHTSHLYSISFLPFIIWRLDTALARRAALPAFEAGALYGISSLGGYPGLTIITGIYAFLWASGRWVCGDLPPSFDAQAPDRTAARKSPTLQPGFILIALSAMLVVGLLVVLPTYMGFFVEGAGYSDRVGRLARHIAVGSNALHPAALATFSSPFLSIIKLYTPSLWRYTDVSLCSIYLGPLVPALALLALATRPRSRWHWWLAGAALLMLGLAMGRALPLRGWLYDLFLPSRYFRHAAIFRDYFMFSTAILALLGARDLTAQERREGIHRHLFLIVTGLAALALLAYTATLGYVIVPGLTLSFLASVWLGALVITGLWSRARQGRAEKVFPALLVALTAADACLTIAVSGQMMYGSPRVWSQINARRSCSLDLTAQGLERLPFAELGQNKNLPLKIAVLAGYSQFSNRFHLEWGAQPALRAAATGPQRMWFSTDVARVSPTGATFAAFAQRTAALGAPPLVLHSRGELLRMPPASETPTRPLAAETRQVEAIAKLPPGHALPVRVRTYGPTELTFDVTCPANGWLLVTDRWARGWRASVNGRGTPVWGGDYIFRATRVREGANRVRFTYHPFGYPWLLALSWAALAAVGIASARAGRRHSGGLA
jgi:branched-subunit amino acid transport protein